MATLSQINANRRNAQRSTGPTSAAGKIASSFNALKTGLHAQSAVLPFEDSEAHDALVAQYYSRLQPIRPEERLFVDELIHAEWLLHRLRRTETELTDFVHESAPTAGSEYSLGQPAAIDAKVFSGLQWRLNSTRKARKQALAALRELRDRSISAVE